MKTMYLKDGRMVDLISEDVDGKALVAPYIDIYESRGYGPDDYDDVWNQQPGQNMIFVRKDDLTEKAPVAVYDQKIKAKEEELRLLQESIKTKNGEVAQLQRDIMALEAKKGDTAKFIFDLTPYRTAKKLVFFRKGYIYPTVIEPDISSYDEDTIPTLQLTLSPGYKKGVESTVKLRYRDRRGYESDEIDTDWGVLFDPTEEEIISKCKERCDTLDLEKFSLWEIQRHKGGDIGYEYLSDKVIDHIEKLEKQAAEAKIKNLEKEAEEAMKKFEAAKLGEVVNNLEARKAEKRRP